MREQVNVMTTFLAGALCEQHRRGQEAREINLAFSLFLSLRDLVV